MAIGLAQVRAAILGWGASGGLAVACSDEVPGQDTPWREPIAVAAPHPPAAPFSPFRRAWIDPMSERGLVDIMVDVGPTAAVDDFCVAVTLQDGRDATLWRRPALCSRQFGHGAGLSYIGFCSTSFGTTNTLSVALLSAVDRAGRKVPARFDCDDGNACRRTFTCVEKTHTGIAIGGKE